MSTFLVIISLLLMNLDISNGLTTYNLEKYCGSQYLRIDGPAATLSFDPRNTLDDVTECIVTIETSFSIGIDEPAKLLFYFTEFELSRYCMESNLTLYDGTYSNKIYARNTYIRGSGVPMCGHNDSLVNNDVFFRTDSSDGRLTIVYRRDPLINTNDDIFTLKLSTYYTDDGSCNNDRARDCPNSICVSEDVYCSDEINACGYINMEDWCRETTETTDDWTNNILQEILSFIWVIVTVLILAGCFKVFRSVREAMQKRKIVREVSRQDAIERAGREAFNLELSSNTSHNDTTNPANVLDLTLEFPQPTDYHASDETLNERDVQASAPPYPGPPTMTSPYAPPPSYDDVIKDSTKYLSTPLSSSLLSSPPNPLLSSSSSPPSSALIPRPPSPPPSPTSSIISSESSLTLP